MIIRKKFLILFFVIALLALSVLGVAYVCRAEKTASAAVDNKNVIHRVIIDAGHGGIDGGAVAEDGTVEKDINLDIALKLKDMLDIMGYQTVLTRDSDISLHNPEAKTIRQKKVSDIHNRFAIINDNPDAIFVSIHQNKFQSSAYSGTQLFYAPNAPDSIDLARSIQGSVTSALQPDNTREIKKCGTEVYLIYHSPIPAVLVECGFLSNKAECEKLKTEEYRREMAFAIMRGIKEYYNGSE